MYIARNKKKRTVKLAMYQISGLPIEYILFLTREDMQV